MPMAQLIITAVTVEGRTKSDVARHYGVSRYWVQELVQRYAREGPIAFLPRSRRPYHSPTPSTLRSRMRSFGCARSCPSRDWTLGAETIAAHLAPGPDGGGRCSYGLASGCAELFSGTSMGRALKISRAT